MASIETVSSGPFIRAHPSEEGCQEEAVALSGLKEKPKTHPIQQVLSGQKPGMHRLTGDEDEPPSRGGKGGPWDDGSLGAALGAFFESIFEEYASGPMSNTDWVNMVIEQTEAHPDVKAKNLNVMVFRENLLKSEFYFLNASMWKTSRDGILGWMNGDYYVVVYEAAWFVAYGGPDERGSSEWNYTRPGDDYVALDGEGQRVALTYPTYDYNLHNYWDASQILDYDRESNHDFYGIQQKVTKWSTADYDNTTAIRSQWKSSDWEQNKTKNWNLDPTY